jgi:hypothetical protein
MADLVVVVPSRGRPARARALAAAFEATCTADTQLMFAVDDDDPTRAEYPISRVRFSSTSMVEALNRATAWADDALQPFAIGFMGDDHMPRTKGWDAAYLDALRELGTGIVYGDDLLQSERLPTQCAMTADIVRALGFMAPPTLAHLYVDDFFLTLGREAGCIRYLPEVVVEHVHPLAGKAEWDPGYLRVNAGAMYARDEAAWLAYAASNLAGDVAKVRALRGAHV